VAQLRRLPKQFLDASAIGQYNAAQDVMEVSQAQAPFEFGALSDAAFVEDPTFTAQSANVEFGYSGPDYIVRQHETEDYNHPGLDSRTSDKGRAQQGRDHFLSNPMNEMAGKSADTIAEAVAEFVATGSLPSVSAGKIGRKS